MFRTLFNCGYVAQIFRDFHQSFTPDFGMQILPSTKANTKPHLDAIVDPAPRILDLDSEMEIIRRRAKADLLHLDSFLLLTRFTLTPLAFVLELTEVHNTTHWWIGIGRDLNQIELRVFSHFQCTRQWHDTDVIILRVNEPHFIGFYLTIDAIFRATDTKNPLE